MLVAVVDDVSEIAVFVCLVCLYFATNHDQLVLQSIICISLIIDNLFAFLKLDLSIGRVGKEFIDVNLIASQRLQFSEINLE